MNNKKGGLMKSCERITELISREKETEITKWEKFHIRFHLLMCRGCRGFEKNVDSLSAMMKSYKNK